MTEVPFIYRNQSIDRSMNWFLHDRDVSHERFKYSLQKSSTLGVEHGSKYASTVRIQLQKCVQNLVKRLQPLTIFAKTSILDVGLSSEYASELDAYQKFEKLCIFNK